MNKGEKFGASELLSGLDEKDVLELAKTVTKAKFNAQNKHEAVQLILRYEADVKSLLSRKKVSANLLTQYLHSKGINFNIDETKLSLCDRVQQYWNSITISNNIPINSGSNFPALLHHAVSDGQVVPSNNTSPSPADYTPADTQVVAVLSESDVSALGVQFVDWFYSQLRGPDLSLMGMSCEHFFSDASCRIDFGDDIKEVIGGEGCASLLVNSLKRIGQGVPVPNQSGIKSQTSAHGAIKVVACGTLHAPPQRMLGAFEQAFLLVRDPTTPDNWKIKYTEMRLKVQAKGYEIEPAQQTSIQY